MDTAPNPVPSYIASIIRSALGILAGFLIGKGYLTAEQGASLSGAMIAVVPVVWSLIQKYNASKALKSAIAAPAGRA